MSLCQVQWASRILKKRVAMNVITPELGEPPFPVFYLLHGLSDDHSAWVRNTRIENYVRNLPLIVVMPDGCRSFYTCHENGPDYASYIAEEVPTFVERNFRAIADRQSRCIGGLSMGGYGALRIALGYPERFVSANSHSGAVLVGSHAIETDLMEDAEVKRIFGRNPAGTDHDLLHLVKRCQVTGTLPALRLDCGRDDFLLDYNRQFHQYLLGKKVVHEYQEFSGSHSWDYWDEHVQDALAFHCQHLNIEPINF